MSSVTDFGILGKKYEENFKVTIVKMTRYVTEARSLHGSILFSSLNLGHFKREFGPQS